MQNWVLDLGPCICQGKRFATEWYPSSSKLKWFKTTMHTSSFTYFFSFSFLFGSTRDQTQGFAQQAPYH